MLYGLEIILTERDFVQGGFCRGNRVVIDILMVTKSGLVSGRLI